MGEVFCPVVGEEREREILLHFLFCFNLFCVCVCGGVGWRVAVCRGVSE